MATCSLQDLKGNPSPKDILLPVDFQENVETEIFPQGEADGLN